MGNMPNRLAGRISALVLAVAFAAAGYFVGGWAGQKLALGFTFDWYVHEIASSYEAGHVLFWVSIAATLSAFLAVVFTSLGTDFAARAWAKRIRYEAPRYRDPHPLDLHVARLAGIVPGLTSLVTVLALYVTLALPMLQGGALIESISPSGFVLLMSVAAGFGALVGTYYGAALTFDGVVDGTLVRRGEPNIIARLSLFASRNAKVTIAAVLVLSLVSGFYATTVTTNVDVADVMPRGDPNTAAAKNLTTTFKSSFTQQATFMFRVLDVDNSTQMRLFEEQNANRLPNRINGEDYTGSPPPSGTPTPLEQAYRGPEPNNITDELYVRAMSEAVQFILDQGVFKASVGAPDLFKLVNWTIAGGQNASADQFGLPGTDPQGELHYAQVKSGVENVGPVFSALDAVTSPTWRQTAILVTVDPNTDMTSREIGEAALRIRDEYVAAVANDPEMYQVFGPDNPPQFSVDLPIANAHASELTKHDFQLLLPIIGVFIALTLFLAFRNVTSVAVTFTMLSTALLWTLGVMGFFKIPLNTLNLAVVPLIMGIGVDYGIHMMNEFQELRARGMSVDQAWTKAGGGSAFALLVGALTTIAGLMVMVISPSLLVAQVGFLGAVAIASCYLLAVLFIPAMMSLFGSQRASRPSQFTPSRIMPTLAKAVSRSRVLVLIVLLLLAGSAYGSQSTLTREAFGDPPRNWLEDDPMRQEHERALMGFYDTPDDAVKANVIIIEGDLTDPAVHDYINGVTSTLRQFSLEGSYTYTDESGRQATAESRVIESTLRDLPFLLNTWLTVKDGVPGAGQYLGKGGLSDLFAGSPLEDPSAPALSSYPRTQEEMAQTLETVFHSPLRTFGYVFADAPNYNMTVITFSVRASSYEDAVEVWNEVQTALLLNEALKPEGVQAHFFGNTAINYLFVAKQVPWLAAMNLVSMAMVVLIVGLSTRRLRPTLAVGAIAGLTSLLWYGLLPHMDIGLAITLTLPLIFIAAMGSDYGLHLALRCQRSGDTGETFESVGKGVLFSFITTLGAFLIFTRISDLAGRRSIVATCLAIGVVFLVTLLVIPLIYPTKAKQERPEQLEPERNVPVVETTIVQGDRILTPETRVKQEL